jgi:hypothetical protein
MRTGVRLAVYLQPDFCDIVFWRVVFTELITKTVR